MADRQQLPKEPTARERLQAELAAKRPLRDKIKAVSIAVKETGEDTSELDAMLRLLDDIEAAAKRG